MDSLVAVDVRVSAEETVDQREIFTPISGRKRTSTAAGASRRCTTLLLCA